MTQGCRLIAFSSLSWLVEFHSHGSLASGLFLWPLLIIGARAYSLQTSGSPSCQCPGAAIDRWSYLSLKMLGSFLSQTRHDAPWVIDIQKRNPFWVYTNNGGGFGLLAQRNERWYGPASIQSRRKRKPDGCPEARVTMLGISRTLGEALRT